MKVLGYKDLSVWQKGIEIVDGVYGATSRFPDREKYGLASQMTRSAVSIPSNIAEGFSRQHTKEYQQFCFVALGSCAELETQVHIAERQKLIDKKDAVVLNELLDHESRMLRNLIKSLKP